MPGWCCSKFSFIYSSALAYILLHYLLLVLPLSYIYILLLLAPHSKNVVVNLVKGIFFLFSVIHINSSSFPHLPRNSTFKESMSFYYAPL